MESRKRAATLPRTRLGGGPARAERRGPGSRRITRTRRSPRPLALAAADFHGAQAHRRRWLAIRRADGQAPPPTEPPQGLARRLPSGGPRRSERAPNPPAGAPRGPGDRLRPSSFHRLDAHEGSLRSERRSNAVLDVRNPASASAGPEHFRLTAKLGGTRNPIPRRGPPAGKSSRLHRPLGRSLKTGKRNKRRSRAIVILEEKSSQVKRRSKTRAGTRWWQHLANLVSSTNPFDLGREIGTKTTPKRKRESIEQQLEHKFKLESLILAQSERLRRA